LPGGATEEEIEATAVNEGKEGKKDHGHVLSVIEVEGEG
jgi:hypothetical protein